MKSVQLESEVGADGVLEIRVPLGVHDARQRVVVTTEPLPASSPDLDHSDWRQFIERTYGSCAGLGLEEPSDLPLQERDL